MTHKTIILAGADIDDHAWLASQIHPDDLIICADSGLRHAHAMGRVPHMIIGDFDSVDPNLLNIYKDKAKIIHDADQNSTDLMKALAHCPADIPIEIYGAMGQRADHDFSTLLILKAMDNPDPITLRNKHETRRVITAPHIINGEIGDYIGLFPLTAVTHFHVEGLKYAPEGLGGPYDFGWNGACNEMIENTATISFDSGSVFVTHSKTDRTNKNR